MAKSKQKTKAATQELDSVYFLKLIMYVIIGTQWLHIQTSSGSQIPVPIGLGVGILFAMHDHFQLDRKIEYAVLLIAMLVGYLAQIGLSLAL